MNIGLGVFDVAEGATFPADVPEIKVGEEEKNRGILLPKRK